MLDPEIIPGINVFYKNTSDSYECASDKAHSLRYEAVWLILPNTNSIISIIWWTRTSEKS